MGNEPKVLTDADVAYIAECVVKHDRFPIGAVPDLIHSLRQARVERDSSNQIRTAEKKILIDGIERRVTLERLAGELCDVAELVRARVLDKECSNFSKSSMSSALRKVTEALRTVLPKKVTT